MASQVVLQMTAGELSNSGIRYLVVWTFGLDRGFADRTPTNSNQKSRKQ